MNKYTLRYAATFLVMLLALSACIKERPDSLLDLPEGTKAIELSIRAQNQAVGSTFRSAATGATTRAYGSEPGDQYEGVYNTDLKENIIDNVEVFLFNTTDGTLKKRFSGTDLQKTGNESSATLRMLIPNSEVAQYEGQNFSVVAVANATITIPTSITSLSALQALVQETTTVNGTAPQAKFLMDGSINTQTINWGTSSTYTVPSELPLRRALAKIRLRIKNVDVNVTENNQTVHYDMVGQPKVKLVHYTEKTSLLQGKPYEVQPTEWKTSGYRSMGSYTFPGKVNDTNTSNPNSFLSANLPFYAYENDWTNDSSRETYLMVEITFRAKNQTGVYGENKAYYYRIPVNYRIALPGMNETEKAGLHKVQRNHLYDIVSSIGILGSEDEGEPFEVDAFVAVQPWNEPDETDGSIRNAHFLVVKELNPLMPNMNTRQVGYLSDLPIQPITPGGNEIQITKTVFEYYDQAGDHLVFTDEGNGVKVTKNGTNAGTYQYNQTYPGFSDPFTKFGGAKVTFDETTNPLNKQLTITHDIPTNYVPYEIYFRVQHVSVEGEVGAPLHKDVHVKQIPPKYITGTKSPGYKPNEGETGPYADFRFHDRIGSWSGTTGTSYYGTQKNEVFYKVTTVVNAETEKIGDPTDTDGRTRRDAESNELISPEFIIASQHGLSNNATPQYGPYENFTPMWSGEVKYGANYGPYSTHFEDRPPYYDPLEHNYNYDDNRQDGYRTYSNADDRCYSYFEGEYGMDGDYTEHYVENEEYYDYYLQQYFTRPVHKERIVKKVFKYKGRWRIPTVAELRYIDKIQDDRHSAVKSLLFGQYYWTAQTGMAYNFTSDQLDYQSVAAVRCVFDTYKVND